MGAPSPLNILPEQPDLFLHHFLRAGQFGLLGRNTVHYGGEASKAAGGRRLNDGASCSRREKGLNEQTAPPRRAGLAGGGEPGRRRVRYRWGPRPLGTATVGARGGRAAVQAAGEQGPAARPLTERTAAAVRVTFLGADSQGSGMVRNALPVGAAGAEEVRAGDLRQTGGGGSGGRQRGKGRVLVRWTAAPRGGPAARGRGPRSSHCSWRSPPPRPAGPPQRRGGDGHGGFAAGCQGGWRNQEAALTFPCLGLKLKGSPPISCILSC